MVLLGYASSRPGPVRNRILVMISMQVSLRCGCAPPAVGVFIMPFYLGVGRGTRGCPNSLIVLDVEQMLT